MNQKEFKRKYEKLVDKESRLMQSKLKLNINKESNEIFD